MHIQFIVISIRFLPSQSPKKRLTLDDRPGSPGKQIPSPSQGIKATYLGCRNAGRLRRGSSRNQKKHMGSRSLHAVIPAIQWTAGCSLLDVHQKSSDICQATACPSTDVALSSPPTLNPSRHSLKDAADGEGRWWGQKQAARSVASLKSITSRNWNEHVLEVDAWTCGMSMLPN